MLVVRKLFIRIHRTNKPHQLGSYYILCTKEYRLVYVASIRASTAIRQSRIWESVFSSDLLSVILGGALPSLKKLDYRKTGAPS